MILFFLGALEMLVITLWTKLVSDTKIMASGVVTVVNILIWYYVLQAVVSDISNYWLVVLYALGCACGTMMSTAYFRLKEAHDRQKRSAREAEDATALTDASATYGTEITRA